MSRGHTHLAGFEPLLDILRCPQTGSPLILTSRMELEAAAAGVPSQSVPAAAVGALVSPGSSRAYPILGQVISFLEDDVLRLSAAVEGPGREQTAEAAIKRDVKRWYDEFGWKRTQNGQYGDTALFSQLGNSAHGFYEMASHLSILHRFMGGEFLLDAASGAIPHPEYLAYGWFYRYRVCVDFSLTALQQAAATLGDRGFYCMADICRLPFRDGVFDGVVSGYTIQHVPASSQAQALAELYRVLGPGQVCCILTDARPARLRPAVARLARMTRRRVRPRVETSRTPSTGSSAPPPSRLYGHAPTARWWRRQLSTLGCRYSVKALRILAKDEFESCFGNSLGAARRLRVLETTLPRALASYSRYLLVEMSKREESRR